jgi:hypothetical protein
MQESEDKDTQVWMKHRVLENTKKKFQSNQETLLLPKTRRAALGLTQPPIQWVLFFLLVVKRLGPYVDPFSPPTAKKTV